jgi:hypothetical protein
VLFRAVATGRAAIKVAYGDPFGEHKSARIVVTVQE